MKKIAVLLAIALVLGISLAVYAGATKIVLTRQDPSINPDVIGTESGFVVVNFPKEGKAIAQFQVRGLDPDEPYWAYYLDPNNPPSEIIGMVKVNKSGSGHLHVMTDEAEPIPGFWLGIANRNSPPPTKSEVILYTWVAWPQA